MKDLEDSINKNPYKPIEVHLSNSAVAIDIGVTEVNLENSPVNLNLQESVVTINLS